MRRFEIAGLEKGFTVFSRNTGCNEEICDGSNGVLKLIGLAFLFVRYFFNYVL